MSYKLTSARVCEGVRVKDCLAKSPTIWNDNEKGVSSSGADDSGGGKSSDMAVVQHAATENEGSELYGAWEEVRMEDC